MRSSVSLGPPEEWQRAYWSADWRADQFSRPRRYFAFAQAGSLAFAPQMTNLWLKALLPAFVS